MHSVEVNKDGVPKLTEVVGFWGLHSVIVAELGAIRSVFSDFALLDRCFVTTVTAGDGGVWGRWSCRTTWCISNVHHSH